MNLETFRIKLESVKNKICKLIKLICKLKIAPTVDIVYLVTRHVPSQKMGT